MVNPSHLPQSDDRVFLVTSMFLTLLGLILSLISCIGGVLVAGVVGGPMLGAGIAALVTYRREKKAE